MRVVNEIYARLKGDKMIWSIVAILCLFSLLLVYSSTGKLAYQYQGGNTEFYLLKHLSLLFLGIMVLFTAYNIHYMKYSDWAPAIMVIAVILLIVTLSLGMNINQARRWIEIPFVGISFQTSDFAKVALILFVARQVTAKQEYIKDFEGAFKPIILPVLIICGLIAPADLSTALLLFVTSMILMFVGRVQGRYIGLLFLLGIVVFAGLIIVGKFFPSLIRLETWVERTESFLSGGGLEALDYQSKHSMIAITEGGWFGVGPGNSIQRNYLPHSYSDFIYSITIEEYGLLGGLMVLLLYLLLFIRCVRLVTVSPKAFGSLLAFGLCLLLVLQALANMAVAVHLVPVTGLTLPLISLGGTSVLFTCLTLGIILSVSQYIEKVI